MMQPCSSNYLGAWGRFHQGFGLVSQSSRLTWVTSQDAFSERTREVLKVYASQQPSTHLPCVRPWTHLPYVRPCTHLPCVRPCTHLPGALRSPTICETLSSIPTLEKSKRKTCSSSLSFVLAIMLADGDTSYKLWINKFYFKNLK